MNFVQNIWKTIRKSFHITREVMRRGHWHQYRNLLSVFNQYDAQRQIIIIVTKEYLLKITKQLKIIKILLEEDQPKSSTRSNFC